MHSVATAQTQIERKACPRCNGTGGAQVINDYARQSHRTEFCDRCDGYGYINVPAPALAESEGAAA